jgi:hypothetical protein
MANTKGRTTTRDVNAAQRASLALTLRAKKLTYQEIAAQCGYASRGAAHDAVQRELDRVIVEDVETLRREEGDSLDRLEVICWKRLESAAHEKAMLFAVDRILAIKERRARLFGLDKKPDELMGPQVVIEEVPIGYLEGPKP